MSKPLWVERWVHSDASRSIVLNIEFQSDPYVRVLLHNIIMARTEVISNSKWLGAQLSSQLCPLIYKCRLEPRVGPDHLCTSTFSEGGKYFEESSAHDIDEG
jgi:hypothetical protein